MVTLLFLCVARRKFIAIEQSCYYTSNTPFVIQTKLFYYLQSNPYKPMHALSSIHLHPNTFILLQLVKAGTDPAEKLTDLQLRRGHTAIDNLHLGPGA